VTLVPRWDNAFFQFLLGRRYIRAGARKIVSRYVTTVPGRIRIRAGSADITESYVNEETYRKKADKRFYEAKERDVVLGIHANIGVFLLKISRLVV
jgi:hypothetical protein